MSGPEIVQTDRGAGLALTMHGGLRVRVPAPVDLVIDGDVHDTSGYDTTSPVPDGITGSRRVVRDGLHVEVRDTWTPSGADEVALVRHLTATRAGEHGAGVQLRLRLCLDGTEARFFVPGMAYTPDQWADGGVHEYADHHLAYPLTVAYLPARACAVSLERTSPAGYDAAPQRTRGQSTFLQATDVGSVGFAATDGGHAACSAQPPSVATSR